MSEVTSIASLVQQSPALALAVVALLAALWTFRQSRRAIAEAEARAGVSAVRQGKRIGALEKGHGLLDMRRRITEDELLDYGIRLSYWPPDGHPEARPPLERDEDRAEDAEPATEARPSIPPLPAYPHHRR